jgi:hypothetical protein
MISFNVSSVPQLSAAADSVFALIALIENSDRARKFLADLKVILDDAGRDAARLEAEKHHAEIKAQERILLDRKNQLDLREVGLGDVARDLATREAALSARISKLKQLTP